jgi:hypothetical protein
MSQILTYWERPKNWNGQDEDAFEGIKEIRLKTVKQIPELLARKPKHCSMISVEHSSDRTLKSGRKTNFFRELWRAGQPLPRPTSSICPCCNQAIKG